MTPRLSIIVASLAPGDNLQSALRSPAHGGLAPELEVILAERISGTALSERACIPEGVIRVQGPTTATLPQLLGTALERARGEIIAITDTRCEIDDGWTAAILRAHELPYAVIGGAIEPGALPRLVDWAAYLAEYGQFMLPQAQGVATELPGNNISMKRWAFERRSKFASPEFWKTYWCDELQADGLQLYIAPQIVVRYQCAYNLWPFLVRRFHHGRCFGGMRLEQLSGLWRVAYIAGALVLPLLLLGRIVRAVLPKRRYLGKLTLAMPIILLAMLSWALGECTGYAFGSGRSCGRVR